MSLSSEGENSATAPRIARAARAAAAQRAILCRHQTSKHYDAIQYYPDEPRREDAPQAIQDTDEAHRRRGRDCVYSRLRRGDGHVPHLHAQADQPRRKLRYDVAGNMLNHIRLSVVQR